MKYPHALSDEFLKRYNIAYLIGLCKHTESSIQFGSTDKLSHSGIIKSEFYGIDAFSRLYTFLSGSPQPQIISQGSTICLCYINDDNWIIGAFVETGGCDLMKLVIMGDEIMQETRMSVDS